MQYGMLEPKEIDALLKAAWGERVEVYSYSLEIMAPTGFETMPDMYFFLGTILRAHGDARAAAERERCISICTTFAARARERATTERPLAPVGIIADAVAELIRDCPNADQPGA